MEASRGNTKAGLSIEIKNQSQRFGFNMEYSLETGGVLVGEKAKITAEILIVKQQFFFTIKKRRVMCCALPSQYL